MAKPSRFEPVARPRVVDASGRRSTLSPPPPSEHGGIDNRARHATANIHNLDRLSRSELRALWTQEVGEHPPATLGRDVLVLAIAYARQERRQGGLSKPVARELDRLFDQTLRGDRTGKAAVLTALLPRSGTILVREWQGTSHHVTVVDGGFLWNGKTYRSLSGIARAITGTSWNGPRFLACAMEAARRRSGVMTDARKIMRCAVYTRKSSEHGLEQDFNSLDAQREAAEAYIKSQAHEGWKLIKTHYADGGLSGGTLERPALQALLGDIRARKIDVVVVYKVDRLTRSLADFANLVELFEAQGVSFVSVTQQFNTTTSMGRLTLNVLLSFAQFERESERIRDKFAASRRKGMWMGGTIPLGYDVKDRKLIVNAGEAETVRLIFERYLALGGVSKLKVDLDQKGIRSKQRVLTSGRVLGGCCFDRGALYHLLRNRIYRGEVVHRGAAYPGEHKPIVDEELWNAVQARLSANLTERRQARIASGTLLAGVIFDDRGHRMSPTYTVRRRNRYRYYISQAQLRGGEPGSRPRIGADEVEQLVVQELCRRQGRDHQATDVAADAWSADIRELVRTMIDRIVIHHDGIEIVLKSNASDHAGRFDDGDTQNESPTTVRFALPPPSPRARKQIIVPGNSGTRPRRIDHELIRALARARSWMGMLQQGEFADTAEIAQRHGLSEPHVRRLLRFAYLAPDIVEAIVEGRQARTLTVKLLLQGVPLDWSDQRAALGFR